jgi:DNA-binding transcriptional LysR family regulator
MQNKQPGWDDLRVLLAVHRGGSFLAAGLELGVSTSTVARRVSTLEAELGRVLVHRTSQGTLLEADTLQLVLLAETFEQALATHRRDARSPYAGVVRVSVPDGLSTLV